ncbi:cupredoxin domain-containing protein [Natronosalvus vescus]|uniref:cupredoxin domain-containing protein n=1 Tax=Natronosalvus vescus TaxID=2953881 RepID=UPI0020913DD2|nr:plastocyanin/azurin family copper-binding protein [Natronosalvus vescus]
MRSFDSLSRRTMMALAGTGVTVAVAGCVGNGDDGDSGDPEEWEDVSEIELDGQVEQWTGVSPDPIDGVENPTLVLFDGNEYELTWYNQDGQEHNIAFVDDGGDIVVDTEWTDDDEQSLTFEATEEMVEYHCEPHQTSMVGDVEVHTG